MKFKIGKTGLLILFIALCLTFTSCSSSSRGGGRDGSGSFSDEDLALGSRKWGDGNIPEAQANGLFQDIHFSYDSSSIPQDYYELVRKNAEVLVNDPSVHAEVEGHCDKRGTNEYNLALGEERARSVAAVMESFGARPNQLSIISYGEEIPIDPGDNDEAYAKNRRVHFALYRMKDGKK